MLVWGGVCLCLAGAFAGCGTTRESGSGGQATVMPLFTPVAAKASIQWVAGRYPNLFSPSSYAVWPVATGEGEAAPAAAMYLDIACHIASEFADTSIAYDVVGLRGVDVYLITPDGAQVRPIQIQRGTELIEEARGALRYFARTNRLLFPLRALELRVPPGGPPSARLVLEAHGAVYQFEWPANLAGMPPAPPPKRPTADAAREAWGTAREVMHTFD